MKQAIVRSNAPIEISGPRDSSRVAKEWLAQFAEVTQKEITPALANIWAEQLRDIEPEQLHRCCDRLLKSWTIGFLPVPGNVRELVDDENTAATIQRVFEEQKASRERERKRALAEHRNAVAAAEKRKLLPAPAAEFPKVKITPVYEPRHFVDFESRSKELKRQAELVKAKYAH